MNWLRWSAILLFAMTLSNGVQAEEPIPVELGVFVVDVTSLNEQNSTFQIEADIISRWTDPARAFIPAEGEPTQFTLVAGPAEEELRRLWWPAMQPINLAASPDFGELRMTVFQDGTVNVRARMRMLLRAPLDFHEFPFDTQVLPMRVESMMWPTTQMVLRSAEEFTGFDDSFEMPEWTLVDLTTEAGQVLRKQEGLTYDRLSFNISIERKAGFYVWKIMLPMAIIVMLSWVVFWMSTEQLGRRAGISSTGMLTIIAYQFIVAGSLPRFPYFTLMDRLMLIALLAIAATMLVNLVGSRLDEDRRHKLDRSCRFVFPVVFLVAVFMVI